MNKLIQLFTAVVMIASIGALSSCKKTFDSPPGSSDPAIVANTSIKDLKARHTVAGAYDIITSDIIIAGTVVANDKSGNLYKQLFIQDSTGGLQILLDANSLYGTYPVGRKIWIRCNGLCISDYNGLMELGVKATIGGLPTVDGIPANLISNYVIGGSLNNPVVPKIVTLSQLGTNMQDKYLGSLIQLDSYAFASLTGTYSDTSAYKSTVNRDIKNCTGQTVIVRTSAYANFAGKKVAQGRGSVLAIYTAYGTTKQLLLRDSSDVKFTDPYDCPLPAGTLLLEDFENQTANTTFPYVPITVAGWNNLSEVGGKFWDAKIFSSNKYAYMSAFGTALPSVKTWLVTKGVNLNATATETLTFQTKQDFILTVAPGGTNVESALKVLVSTDYPGTGNPWTTGTWTDITSQATLSPGSLTGNFPSSYTNSGNINLSSYTGTIYVAFRYEGADNAGTTTDKTSAWEIDNVKIIGN
jgi:Family of unknown function (DUF5689)/Domain of unknown function (DUF5017)